MADTPQTPKKTLTIGGGTLSVGAPSAPRSGGSVSVEVRRRRFDSPSAVNANVPSATTATSEEMQRRMAALQASQTVATPSTEENRPLNVQEALAKASMLQEDRVKQASERQAAETEARAVAAAEKAKAAAAAPVSTARAGSGAGGVQSGTLASSGPGRTVDSKAFAATKSISLDDARKRSSSGGKPENRDLASKRGRNAYLEDLADRQRASSSGRRRRGPRGEVSENTQSGPAEKVLRQVVIPEFITVAELAARMTEKASDVVKKLMTMGEFVTANQTIDQSTAEVIVTEFGHTAVLADTTSIEDTLLEGADTDGTQITRPPIVTVMGHVDHGKTTLLDNLRKSSVVKGEAGGITQHIGAYQVTAPSGRQITFLDTPGHAAFTAMRARGAKVTDVVILVVAADDGIMPQTIEAIQHARAADVPIVVALNKMDKPGVNPAKVKNDLLAQDVVIEEFGGTVPCVPVSGLTGMGLAELEEIVLLQADVLDLKANPGRRADGTVVEARLDKGRGPVATVVVSRGTLRVGDILVAGQYWGRVRALINDRGQNVKEAGPSMPVEIHGLQGVPAAGDQFIVTENERAAKDAASQRDQNERERAQAARKMTLENLMEKMASEGQKDLNVIIKADVQGSTEAITFALNQLNADQSQVKVKVVTSAVGVITENDVNLAVTASALVVGFNVRADATAREVADRAGIELRYYSIIYNLVDDIKAAMSGLLAPSQVEEITGQAEIRAIFTFERTKIAGCMVTEGKLTRGTKMRILRDGKVIHSGELASIRRGKDDVKEVAGGFECGMTFANFTDFKEGDVVEGFHIKEVKRTIDDLKQLAAREAKAAGTQPTA